MLFNTFNNFKCPGITYFTVEMQEPLERSNAWFCAHLQDIIFFLHSTEQKTIPSTGMNFWPIRHLLQQEHKKHSCVACQLNLLYVTRWTSGSIALRQPWQICLETKQRLNEAHAPPKSNKSWNSSIFLEKKRNVLKEAFELSLQLLICLYF